jgi:hypothetical protein
MSLSDAVPLSVTVSVVVVNVVPLVGDVIVTTGFVLSVAVDEVTVSVSVLVLPAASRAVIVRVCEPLTRWMPAADQEVVPVATPEMPFELDHVTCVTPTLSDAVPERVTELAEVENVVPDVGAEMVTLGALESVNVTASVSVLTLPAASRAVTVRVFSPGNRVIPLADQLVVPVAVPVPPVRLFDQETCVTPTLSEAVPPSVTDAVVVLKVVPAVGDVMVTVGAVLSAAGVYVTVSTFVPTFPAASRALTVIAFEPL